MFNFIMQPFGVAMKFIYEQLAFQNYGLAIIFFTLFVKILLFPLNLKQQKSTLRTQALQPELEALKRVCGDDQQLLMQEQQKLYTKYGVNPMSGCLPTLIQFPIIIGVYNIVIKPLTYLAEVTDIAKLIELSGITTKNTAELFVNSHFLAHPELITSEVKAVMGDGNFINMTFLKIFDLGIRPTACFNNGIVWKYVPLLLIPIITLLSQYVMQWMSNPNKGKKNKGKKEVDPTTRSMNSMLKIMPLMTFVIALTTPAGLGFYWVVSNLLTLLQTYLINKFFIDKKEG